MRQWNIQPKYLCKNHLLGEHVEHHMFIGCLKRNKSIKGYISRGLVEVHNLIKRHDELAQEMENRGYKHNSPINTNTTKLYHAGSVSTTANITELKKRCQQCKARINKQEKYNHESKNIANSNAST